MMESGASFCNSCGEQVGVDANGEVFVACHELFFPICKACVDYENNEGRRVCLRCGNPYAADKTRGKDATEVPGNQSTLAAQISISQDVGLHVRHISIVSTVDSELNDESGNPIWKNRVESWKEKDKKNKKKAAPKSENEAPVPQEQQMEEMQTRTVPSSDFSDFYMFNMGSHASSSFNSHEDRYQNTSAYMPAKHLSYNVDNEPNSSSGKAVVGWLKLKVTLRWGIFVRKKAADRRAQLIELDDS